MQILDTSPAESCVRLAIGVIRINYEWHDNDNNVQIVCTHNGNAARNKDGNAHVKCH